MRVCVCCEMKGGPQPFICGALRNTKILTLYFTKTVYLILVFYHRLEQMSQTGALCVLCLKGWPEVAFKLIVDVCENLAHAGSEC